jgi:hypothetical protein
VEISGLNLLQLELMVKVRESEWNERLGWLRLGFIYDNMSTFSGSTASFLKIIVRVKRAIRLKKMIQRDWS